MNTEEILWFKEFLEEESWSGLKRGLSIEKVNEIVSNATLYLRDGLEEIEYVIPAEETSKMIDKLEIKYAAMEKRLKKNRPTDNDRLDAALQELAQNHFLIKEDWETDDGWQDCWIYYELEELDEEEQKDMVGYIYTTEDSVTDAMEGEGFRINYGWFGFEEFYPYINIIKQVIYDIFKKHGLKLEELYGCESQGAFIIKKFNWFVRRTTPSPLESRKKTFSPHPLFSTHSEDGKIVMTNSERKKLIKAIRPAICECILNRYHEDDTFEVVHIAAIENFELYGEFKDEFIQDEISSIIVEIMNEFIAKEKPLQSPTSLESLELAYDELSQLGIMTKHDYGCCSKGGASDIHREYIKIKKDERASIIGYAFYTHESMFHANKNKKLVIEFGRTDNKKKFVSINAIAEIVCDVFNKHGLDASWSGNYEDSIIINNFTWQVRKLIPALLSYEREGVSA